MSFGWHQIRQYENFKDRARQFGLDIARPKLSIHEASIDCFALIPLGNAFPLFSRDAELFIGNLDQAEQWLAGMEWAHNYHIMIKATSQAKIRKCEHAIRNDVLIKTLSEK